MTLTLSLSKSEFELKLIKNGRTIDFEGAIYYHDLSNLLINGLDKLIRRNNIDTTVISSPKISCPRLQKKSTAYKIATVFIKALTVKNNRLRVKDYSTKNFNG